MHGVCTLKAYENGSQRMNQEPQSAGCPCGSGKTNEACCGGFLGGDSSPQTAEQLMRSRYCGFVHRDDRYLLATWHPDTRPSRVRFDDQRRWLGLSIRSTLAGEVGDAEGYVEFLARYKMNGKGHRLHEKSRCIKIDSEWYYVDGEFL